jgi:hypothetical protein
MQKKYGVLRTIATINKIIAWIVLVLGVLGGCVSLAFGLLPGLTSAGSRTAPALLMGGLAAGLMTSIGAIFFAVVYFLVFYSFGEMIYLLIDLEENTRTTAEHLKNIPKA